MQKFLTSTLISKYIKKILSSTPLPLLKSIDSVSYIIEGKSYIYNNNIIKCTKSGYINPVMDKVRASNAIRCSTNLLCGSYISLSQAQFQVIDRYIPDQYVPGQNYYFRSKYGYYDSQTHKALRDLLRLYKSCYNLNLMHMYNCFNNNISEKTYKVVKQEDRFKIEEDTSGNFKTLLIPAFFAQDYTIAYNSNSHLQIFPLIINNYGLVKNNLDGSILSDELINNGSKIISTTLKFNTPIKYNIPYSNTNNLINNFESNLFIAITVPINSPNNLVVIEGDYSSTNYRSLTYLGGYDYNLLLENGSIDKPLSGRKNIGFYTYTTHNNIDKELQSVCATNPSLLLFNTEDAKPFSDNLIQYLLENPITENTLFDEDIEHVKEQLGVADPAQIGIWNSDIQKKAYFKYMNTQSRTFKLDVTGYIDNQIEAMLISQQYN